MSRNANIEKSGTAQSKIFFRGWFFLNFEAAEIRVDVSVRIDSRTLLVNDPTSGGEKACRTSSYGP